MSQINWDLLNAAKIGAPTTEISNLVVRGGNANFGDSNQWRPIHYAAKNGNVDSVMMVLKYGAKVDAATQDQITPLHLATAEGHLEVVQCLIDNGADVDLVDKTNETALHKAALNGHSNIARFLAEAHAHLDVVSVAGHTPLHHAARLGHLPVVKVLIENGADFVAPTKEAKSALDIASEAKFASIAYVLSIIATKRLRATKALSMKLDKIVSIDLETVNRTLDKSGGVLQTPSGAQVICYPPLDVRCFTNTLPCW
jgi:ankyrin repeat protein